MLWQQDCSQSVCHCVARQCTWNLGRHHIESFWAFWLPEHVALSSNAVASHFFAGFGDIHVVIPFCDQSVIVRTRSDIICAMAVEKLKPVYIEVLPFLL